MTKQLFYKINLLIDGVLQIQINFVQFNKMIYFIIKYFKDEN